MNTHHDVSDTMNGTAPGPQSETESPDLSKAERKALAERFMPFAAGLAKPLGKAWPGEAEELQAAAWLALVQAAENFDPSRGVKFSTFARRRIRGELTDTLRLLNPKGFRHKGAEPPRVVSLSDHEQAEEQGRVIGRKAPPRPEAEVEQRDEVDGLLRGLSARANGVVRRLYLADEPVNEVARSMRLSPSRVLALSAEARAQIVRESRSPA